MYSRYDPTGRTVFRPLDAEIGSPQDVPVGDFVSVPDGYSGTAFVRDDAASADFAEARGGFADSGGSSRETYVSAGTFPPGRDVGGAPSGDGNDGTGASLAGAETGDADAVAASSPARDGGILASLRGMLGKLFGGDGVIGGLDLGDIILLLIVALLFLEDGKPSDLVILAAVALFIGL